MIRNLGQSMAKLGATVAVLQQTIVEQACPPPPPKGSVLFQEDTEEILDELGNLRGDRIGLSSAYNSSVGKCFCVANAWS
jgi:hypothetical protein